METLVALWRVDVEKSNIDLSLITFDHDRVAVINPRDDTGRSIGLC